MKQNEFNLSEKMWDNGDEYANAPDCFFAEDVKEAVRRLEKYCLDFLTVDISDGTKEIFGDKLT